MLCSVGLIVSSLQLICPHMRRAYVRNQLHLWITEPPPEASLWKDLGAEERTALITTRTRIIAQAVHPEPTHETQEENHES